MLDAVLDSLAALPVVPAYLVLMALSALENVFPPVPADTAVALGAFLARRGHISVVPLAVLCWLANMASASVTYGIARVHGPEPTPVDLPWLLAPAAAGTLVRAIAHALHVGPSGTRFPVGAGWILSENPVATDAMTGGRFDDVGHTTRAIRLSDGKTGSAALVGPGHAWRATFRERPAFRPAHLGVAQGGAPPDRRIDVLDLKVMALNGGVWVLEGLGRYPDGSGGIVRRQARPIDVVAACRAAVGEPRATADDVTTPGLVLDLP